MPRIFLKKTILPVLKVLDAEYQKASMLTTPIANDLMFSFARNAVVTVGGWLEDGFDETAELSIIKLKKLNIQTFIHEQIGFIYGFNYKKHVSRAVSMSFGAHGLEYIESKVGASDIAILSATLEKIEKWRNSAAHSMATIHVVPKQIISEVNLLYPILRKFVKSAKQYIDLL